MQGCGSVAVVLSTSLLCLGNAAGMGAENPPNSTVQICRAISHLLHRCYDLRIVVPPALAGLLLILSVLPGWLRPVFYTSPLSLNEPINQLQQMVRRSMIFLRELTKKRRLRFLLRSHHRQSLPLGPIGSAIYPSIKLQIFNKISLALPMPKKRASIALAPTCEGPSQMSLPPRSDAILTYKVASQSGLAIIMGVFENGQTRECANDHRCDRRFLDRCIRPLPR